MGKSNFLHALESKLGHLLGQVNDERQEAIKIERLARTLSTRWDKIAHLDKVIEAVELVITHYHPDWQRDTIDPIRPQVHQIPIPIGEAGRKALEVLRDTPDGMTVRQVAKEVLRRENLPAVNQATVDRVSKTVYQAFKIRKGKLLETDGNWPEKWSVIR